MKGVAWPLYRRERPLTHGGDIRLECIVGFAYGFPSPPTVILVEVFHLADPLWMVSQ